MFHHLRQSFLMLLFLTVITGVLYPLAVTGAAKTLFPRKAEGSLEVRDGVVVGSTLIGQAFDDPRYFWGRPSATTPPCNGAASSGSNLGPTNPALKEAVEKRIAALRASDPENPDPIPIDLVTASASGLDPHITPAGALWQVRRIARDRHLAEDVMRKLVDDHVEGRDLGILGEPRVNVLRLNLALDATR
ncbi:MAG: potassium-transporting ATPase subunit KdpC [Planctomycetes bacterium]|nr:potassium-transporting ATPase subunit KdpC [Planctomycetota bacterium]MBI3848597.1 potassium-transporting ATPase subunit KdpC [Planctomycetota bacterium]